MKYDDLKALEELRESGAITEEEFQKEKGKILNTPESPKRDNLMGFQENTYIMFMHLSQFSGVIIPFLGFILPIIMWMTNTGENKNENVDRHGKNIINFMISMVIYCTVAGLLCFVVIGIPMLIVLVVLEIIFVIIAAFKAANGEYWKYPMSIQFFS